LIASRVVTVKTNARGETTSASTGVSNPMAHTTLRSILGGSFLVGTEGLINFRAGGPAPRNALMCRRGSVQVFSLRGSDESRLLWFLWGRIVRSHVVADRVQPLVDLLHFLLARLTRFHDPLPPGAK
jgi:hypothetical protein